jgi:hypothetical protein
VDREENSVQAAALISFTVMENLSPFLQEDTMRSELVFGATTYVSNRFLLAILAAKTTRKLHKPNTRIEDTANDVFERFARANPLPRVPSTGGLQSFPSAAQAEIQPSYEDLQQSVA